MLSSLLTLEVRYDTGSGQTPDRNCWRVGDTSVPVEPMPTITSRILSGTPCGLRPTGLKAFDRLRRSRE